jgi:paired amphipathic helix protein Sin3a
LFGPQVQHPDAPPPRQYLGQPAAPPQQSILGYGGNTPAQIPSSVATLAQGQQPILNVS